MTCTVIATAWTLAGTAVALALGIAVRIADRAERQP